MIHLNRYAIAAAGILITFFAIHAPLPADEPAEAPTTQQADQPANQPASAESYKQIEISQILALNEMAGTGTLTIEPKTDEGKALAELRRALSFKGFKPMEVFAVKGSPEDAVKAARDYIVKGQQPARQFARDDKVLLVFHARPFDVADIVITAINQSPAAIEIVFRFEQPTGGQKPKKVEQLVLIPVTLGDAGKIKLDIVRDKGKMTKGYFDSWTKDVICSSSELTVATGQEKKLSDSELDELAAKTVKDKSGETGELKLAPPAAECEVLGKIDVPNPMKSAIVRTYSPSDSAKPRQFVCVRRDGGAIFPFKAEQLKEVLRDEDAAGWTDEQAIQFASLCVHLTDPLNESGWILLTKQEDLAGIKGMPPEARKSRIAAPTVFKKQGDIIITLYAWHASTGSLKQWIVTFGKTFDIRPKELGKFKPDK
ncbi:MAG: hypothetical protein HZA50_07700 [Planctomycetes bacterium]|nr:hypothetical protein [Planctomycetota bacterium]